MQELIFVFFVAVVASFVQSSIGFGSAMICMALWPLVLSYSTSVVLELVTAFVLVAQLAFILRKHINYKLLIAPCIISIIFSFLGVQTLLSLDDSVMKIIMGVVLIVLSAYFMFFIDKVKLKPNISTGVLAGVASGFMGGLFAVGGPPMVAYYMSVAKDNNEYNATLQAYFIVNNLSLFIIHLLSGNVSMELVPLSVASIAGVLLGIALGIRVFKKLTGKNMKMLVCIFMFIMGVYNIIRI